MAYWKDLRHIRLIRKRYKPPTKMGKEYWGGVIRRYGNMQKALQCSDWHWRVIYYDDGRTELAYLRVLRGGIFSGMYSAIYRGLIIPHMIGYGTFAHITKIELAF